MHLCVAIIGRVWWKNWFLRIENALPNIFFPSPVFSFVVACYKNVLQTVNAVKYKTKRRVNKNSNGRKSTGKTVGDSDKPDNRVFPDAFRFNVQRARSVRPNTDPFDWYITVRTYGYCPLRMRTNSSTFFTRYSTIETAVRYVSGVKRLGSENSRATHKYVQKHPNDNVSRPSYRTVFGAGARAGQ